MISAIKELFGALWAWITTDPHVMDRARERYEQGNDLW